MVSRSCGCNPDDIITLNLMIMVQKQIQMVILQREQIQINVHDDAPVALGDVATFLIMFGLCPGECDDNDNVGEDQPGYVCSDVSLVEFMLVFLRRGSNCSGVHGVLENRSYGCLYLYLITFRLERINLFTNFRSGR